MLKGYLASTSFYACTEHNAEVLDEYLNNLNDVFNNISENIARQRSVRFDRR